jgi:hypothetical protein
MKRFVIFLVIAILAYVAGSLYPWWSVAVVGFVVILIVPLRPPAAFVIGFLAVFVLWGSMAFYKGIMNDHILDTRISVLFLQRQAPWVITGITGVIGGLVTGTAAMTAAFLRTRKRPAPGDYSRTVL